MNTTIREYGPRNLHDPAVRRCANVLNEDTGQRCVRDAVPGSRLCRQCRKSRGLVTV